MKILGEENPNAPWMGAIRREYGDLAEYPVIPLLSRTQTFPLLFQKKESQWIHTDMAHPQRPCRCLERRGCPGLHRPEPVPEFAPLPERGFIYVSTDSPLPPQSNVESSRSCLSLLQPQCRGTCVLLVKCWENHFQHRLSVDFEEETINFWQHKFEINISESYMKGCCDISQNSLYAKEEEILLCCFSEFLVSMVVKKAGSPTTIQLKYKVFHQFSLVSTLTMTLLRPHG